MTLDVGNLRIAIARDLRQIEQLVIELHWQVEASPNAKDFPGGTALHMAGPAVVLQDWEIQYARKETLQRFDPDTGDDRWEGPLSPKGEPTSNLHDPAIYQSEADAAEQPLNVLGYWTRRIREERDQPTNLKPTVGREVDYLRKQIDWMLAPEGWWPGTPALADDLRTLVRALENTLLVGSRVDRSAAACFHEPAGDGTGVCGGELVRITLRRRECAHWQAAKQRVGRPWSANVSVDWMLAWMLSHDPSAAREHKTCDQGGRDDVYRCLRCEKKYTPAEYWLAVKDGYERNVG
jgi:hypothetical protein